MARKQAASVAPGASKWTPEQLMADRHLGPGMIGDEKYAAIQAYINTTGVGRFGPALLNDPRFNQAGPIKIVDGKPVFAHELDTEAQSA